MGDFNIDLLTNETNEDVNSFCNTMTRPRSKSLIDNILLNSVEFPSHSGNLTIVLFDHLIQFVILEFFLKN